MFKPSRVSGCLPRIILWGLLCFPVLAYSQVVQLTLPSGIVVTADYYPGKRDLPQILLLPGFLQTRLAPPMSSLGRSLADEGYTVVVPNLSLGYSRRNQTLDCEAVHKHNMTSDTAEISFWINWLNKQSKLPVVLIGHSSGSNILLNYLANKPAPNIRGAILTSIVATKTHIQAFRKAREDLKHSGPKELHQYSLAYCQNNYLSTASDYLSYAQWSNDMIISKLRQARTPVQIIIGGSDQLYAAGWKEQILNTFPGTVLIPGSGHFFEDMHELDLLDQVNATLTRWRFPPAKS